MDKMMETQYPISQHHNCYIISLVAIQKKAEMNMLFILHLQYHKHSVQNAGSSRERGYLEKR